LGDNASLARPEGFGIGKQEGHAAGGWQCAPGPLPLAELVRPAAGSQIEWVTAGVWTARRGAARISGRMGGSYPVGDTWHLALSHARW